MYLKKWRSHIQPQHRISAISALNAASNDRPTYISNARNQAKQTVRKQMHVQGGSNGSTKRIVYRLFKSYSQEVKAFLEGNEYEALWNPSTTYQHRDTNPPPPPLLQSVHPRMEISCDSQKKTRTHYNISTLWRVRDRRKNRRQIGQNFISGKRRGQRASFH